MDTAIISAMAIVVGSLVVGAATVTTAGATEKTVDKPELTLAEIRKREALRRLHEEMRQSR